MPAEVFRAKVFLATGANRVHGLQVSWRLLSLLVLTIGLSHAQQTEAPEKTRVPPRGLRLLPLGETPPFRQDVRDGVRYELEPAPGSTPPRQVRHGTGETAVILRLNLGRASEPVKIADGTTAAVFRDASAPDDPLSKPWLSVALPEAGDVLAVIWRDPATRWTQPRALIFADSAVVFPAGTIRIVNLLPTEAALIIGTERLLLGPGKSLLRAIPGHADLPLQVAFKNAAGQYQRFYSGAVLLNANERAQVFIHRADGEKPRQAAKVVTFNEAAPPLPAPPP
jgi:hypothetical protein